MSYWQSQFIQFSAKQNNINGAGFVSTSLHSTVNSLDGLMQVN